MQTRIRILLINIFPLIIFSLISILYFGLDIITHLKAHYVGISADSTSMIWALGWWKHCIEHGLNPFFNTTVWYPYKYNLAQQGVIIWGNFILASPVLFLFGPVVAYNISMLAAPALAGWTTFFLLRYLTKSYWPSIAGAYFFSFSSYMLGHMLGHLMLVTIFLIPVITLLTIKIYRNDISKLWFCFWMSICLSLQFYIAPELLTTIVIFGGLSLLLSFLIFKDGAAIKRTILFIFISLLITLVLVSPYLYLFFLPPKLDPSFFPPTSSYVSDLFSPFIPSSNLLSYITISTYLTNAVKYNSYGILDISEYNCYFGIPALIICFLYCIEFWRLKAAQFCLIGLILIFICALGPSLNVFGKPLFWMPWQLTAYLPFIKFALPVRFGLFISLYISVIIAYWLADSTIKLYFKILLLAFSILFLVPTLNYTNRHWSQSSEVPTLISHGIYKTWLNPHDVVIILPYSSHGNGMLWQVQSNKYFDMAGGYLGYMPIEFEENPTVQAFWQYSTTASLDLSAQPNLIQNAEQFLYNHCVKAIFVYQNRQTWQTFFAKLGMMPINVDGVDVYLTKNILKNNAWITKSE